LEAEAPVVERADDLAVFDPAEAEGAVGVRTSAREGENGIAIAENGDAKARNVEGDPPALPHLLGPTDRDELRHVGTPNDFGKTKTFGLASGPATFVESTLRSAPVS